LQLRIKNLETTSYRLKMWTFKSFFNKKAYKIKDT
jgi:hypothetical protein